MKKLAAIGCGLRTNAYMTYLKDGFNREWELSAVAYPNEKACQFFIDQYGQAATQRFETGPDLFDKTGDDLDMVLIGTPNYLHQEALLPALERKLMIMLEKPIATTFEDCRTIWDAYVKAGRPPLAVGFVMRYISFYRKIIELVESGAIGEILTVEANEQMGPSLTALYMRGWRRLERFAGPLISEKCSHDMDFLNRLIGKPAVKASSFGSRTHMLPKKDAAERCPDCPLQASCRYNVEILAQYMFGDTPETHPLARKSQAPDICVYNCETDIPDHQVAQIEYEGGALVSFALYMDQPRTVRSMRIAGTEGQIIGDVNDDQLTLIRHAPGGYENVNKEIIEIKHDGSGHHGGDSVISAQLKSMLRGEPKEPEAGLREGVESCVVCFAAERSRHEGRIIDVAEMRREMFGEI